MLEKQLLLIRCRNYRIKILLSVVLVFLVSQGFLIAAGFTEDCAYAASGNSRYSLSGAQYQLYTDSTCTSAATTTDGSNAVLTTDENGNSNVLEMAQGTYYAKEIRPGTGYRIDADPNGEAKVYTIQVTASNTSSDPSRFTSSEPPAYGTPDFMVFKKDSAEALTYTKFIGTEFTVKYYDVASREEIKGAEPKDWWTFKAVKKDAPEDASGGTYMAGFDWQNDDPVSYSHEGTSAFYEVSENGEKKRVMPLGWFTIEETAAPAGFELSDRICFGHVFQPNEGSAAVTEIEEALKDSKLAKDTLVYTDELSVSISTTASAQNGNHEIKDVIQYEGLIPGEDYVFRGWLVDTATGEKVPDSDGAVNLTTDSETSGQVEMVMETAKYNDMEGHSLTAFEELYIVEKEGGSEQEILIAEHKDINDSAQTTEFFQDVKVQKNVTGNLGDTTKTFDYTAAFTGLMPNQAYTVEGDDEKVFNADASGKAEIPLKLKDDQSVTIRQLPKGAEYKITETASDHVAGFKVFSEDMGDKGAIVAQASGSNGNDSAKDLGTAVETVDLFDGTVVILWENNRDLATVTAVPSYLDIWAYACALVLAGLLLVILKHRKIKGEQEEK